MSWLTQFSSSLDLLSSLIINNSHSPDSSGLDDKLHGHPRERNPQYLDHTGLPEHTIYEKRAAHVGGRGLTDWVK